MFSQNCSEYTVDRSKTCSWRNVLFNKTCSTWALSR